MQILMEARWFSDETEMRKLSSIASGQRVHSLPNMKKAISLTSLRQPGLVYPESINVSMDSPQGYQDLEPVKAIEEWSMVVGSHLSELNFVAGDKGFLTLSYMV